MNKRNSKEIQDRFADSATAMVMDQYMTDLTENLPAEPDDDSIEISEEFDLKSRKLINRELAKKRWQKIGKKLARGTGAAAIVIVLLLGVFAILFTTVEAFRVPIINFFLDQKEEYLEIAGKDDNSVNAENPLDGLLPAEYKLESFEKATTGNISILYANPQGEYVIYFSDPYTSTIHLDTENASVEHTLVSGRDAILINKNGYQLTWFNDAGDQVYRLDASSLSKEELIEIAEIIEKRR